MRKEKKMINSLRSLKIRNTKLKKLLWKCYSHFQELYGCEGDDFLTGNEFKIGDSKIRGKELKEEVRKIFEKK